jgi:hypothetical protein
MPEYSQEMNHEKQLVNCYGVFLKCFPGSLYFKTDSLGYYMDQFNYC